MYIAFGALFSMSSLAVGLSYFSERGSSGRAPAGSDRPAGPEPQLATPARQPGDRGNTDQSVSRMPRATNPADQPAPMASGADVAAALPSAPVSPRPLSSAEALGNQASTAVAERRAQIERAIIEWADVWSDQDVSAYLSFYADDFRPAHGSLADWRRSRAGRISGPRHIRVRLDDMQVHAWNDEVAAAMFEQVYTSDRIADRSRKVVILTRQADTWRIVREIVLSSTRLR